MIRWSYKTTNKVQLERFGSGMQLIGTTPIVRHPYHFVKVDGRDSRFAVRRRNVWAACGIWVRCIRAIFLLGVTRVRCSIPGCSQGPRESRCGIKQLVIASVISHACINTRYELTSLIVEKLTNVQENLGKIHIRCHQ